MNRVAVAYAHPGTVTGAFTESLLRLWQADAALPADRRRICTEGSGFVATTSGPRIAAARNELVKLFLEGHKAEWLWMLDSDMSFMPSALDILLAVADPKERPIVGGLCFGGGKGWIFPTMYELVDPKENDGDPIRLITDWSDGAVVEVNATGAACLLVHRSVFEKIREQSGNRWFHESIYNGREFGEDWTFCLKAQQLGFSIHIATAAKVGHHKTFCMDEEMWRTGRLPLKYHGGIPAERKAEALEVSPASMTALVEDNPDVIPMNRTQRRAQEKRDRRRAQRATRPSA